MVLPDIIGVYISDLMMSQKKMEQSSTGRDKNGKVE